MPPDEDLELTHDAHQVQFSSIKITLPSNGRLVCCEKGSLAYYSVQLTSKPKFDVEVRVVTNNELVSVHPTLLVFTKESYCTPQKVSVQTVLSMNSTTTNADVLIKHVAHSKDLRYTSPKCAITPSLILVSTIDTDAPHLFSFGEGSNGQLGTNMATNIQYEPVHVDFRNAQNLPAKRNGWSAISSSSPRSDWDRPWRDNVVSSGSNIYGKPVVNFREEKKKKLASIRRVALKEKLNTHLNLLNVNNYMNPMEQLKSRREQSSTVHTEKYQQFVKSENNIYESPKQIFGAVKTKTVFDEDSHNSVKAALFSSGGNNAVEAVASKRAAKRKKKKKKPLSFTEVHAIKVALDKRNVDKVNAKNKPYNLSHIAAGNSFSCCVSGKGKLYTWGINNFGQLGQNDFKQRFVPHVWNFHDWCGKVHKKVVMVSCGEAHVAIVNGSGRVLTFGRGQNGRLGHGNEHNVKIPRVVEFEESHKSSEFVVDTVCCGLKHTLALTQDHKVYSWGFGKPGSLGLCHRKTRALRRQDVLRPERVSFLDSYRTKLMSAGAHHSIFLVGGHGYALSCGYGENGQLGRKVQGSDVTPRPVEMPQGEAISHVASGYSHTLVLCQNNHVYAFGSNEYGQLGLSNRHSKLKPTRLVTLSNIQICALYAGYHHSCAISEDGYVYMWGQNSASNCGIGTTKEMIDILEPRIIESLAGVRVVQAALGHSHSLLTSLELQQPKHDSIVTKPEEGRQKQINDAKVSLEKKKQHLFLLKVEERLFNERILRIKRLKQHIDIIHSASSELEQKKDEIKYLNISEKHKNTILCRLKGELIGWKLNRIADLSEEKINESKRMRHWILNTIQKLKNMRSLELLSRVEAKHKQGRPQTAPLTRKGPRVPMCISKTSRQRPTTARARLGREKENKRSKADRNVDNRFSSIIKHVVQNRHARVKNQKLISKNTTSGKRIRPSTAGRMVSMASSKQQPIVPKRPSSAHPARSTRLTIRTKKMDRIFDTYVATQRTNKTTKNTNLLLAKQRCHHGGPGIRMVDKSDFNLPNTRVNEILPEEGVAHKLDKSMNRVYV